MPQNNQFIILIFENKKQSSEFPKNIDDLKKICAKIFGIAKIENFSFYYREKNNYIDIEIKDAESFEEWESDIFNLNRYQIIIKEKSNNLTHSELYNFPQINSRPFPEIQNTIVSNESEKEDLSVYNNIPAVELRGNINSSQIIFSTQDYYRRRSSTSSRQLRNQLSDNDSINKQNSVSNRSIISNQTSHEINSNNLNKYYNMNTIIIMNLEINALREKISKLEEEINNKKLKLEKYETNEKKIVNSLEEAKKQIQELMKENQKLKKENDELNKNNNDLKKNYNNLQKKINKLREKNEELVKENKDCKKHIKIKEKSMFPIIQNNIKCSNCGLMPINGYIYKCSICNEHNLCQQCLQTKLDLSFHQHPFDDISKLVEIIFRNE